MYFVSKFCDTLDIKSLFLHPTLLSVFAVGIAYGEFLLMCQKFGENTLTVLIPIATAVLLYLVLGCLFGLISEEDISSLPMGKKICMILEKMHLFHAAFITCICPNQPDFIFSATFVILLHIIL